MRIDIATLFPEMCETVLNESILGRARRAGYIEFACHNIRGYTTDRHGRVDDYGYGGGKGMVMQPEPIQRCFTDVCAKLGKKPHVIYMSPQGRVLTQQRCMELSRMDNLFILCGHYEGVDERVLTEMVDEEISIGDYVLTGGELPALVLTDAVARMCGGVLAASECYEEESHMGGLLEYPQYTRPEEWRGQRVPDILLSGHHKKIAEWRLVQRLVRTRKKRPDLYEKYPLGQKEIKLLEKYAADAEQREEK